MFTRIVRTLLKFSHKIFTKGNGTVQNLMYHCTCLVRLRHGPLMDVSFLVDILPQLVVDFLPPTEVLQTVVTEFVSPHQTRPKLAACVMAEVHLESDNCVYATGNCD